MGEGKAEQWASMEVLPMLPTLVGSLGVIEFEALPFRPQRAYWLTNTPGDATRGLHAHKSLEQVLIALGGSVSVHLVAGDDRETVLLDSHGHPLHIRPGVWRELKDFTPDAVILVLASQPYDPADYIHDFEEFERWRSQI